MKRILIILIVLQTFLLAFLFITTFKVDTPLYQFGNVITEAKDSTVILQAKVDLLEKHESWILIMLGIGLTVSGIILGLIQWYYSKKAEDYVYNELAKKAKSNKKAFQKAIEMKAIEIELMSGYPIYIISSMVDNEKSTANELYKLLTSFDFKDVDKLSYKKAEEKYFTDKTVLVFCNEKDQEGRELNDSISINHLINMNAHVAVLCVGKSFSLENEHSCLSFANRNSQVYNNLMSLLHYKRYLLSKCN